MDIGQYLEVRRCFCVQRKMMPSDARIIFDEFAILCELQGMRNASASKIAAAQGISCPTMTHRSNHLCELGFMVREPDAKDRRKLRCSLTRKGTSLVSNICRGIARTADESAGLADMRGKDMVRLVADVGTLPMPADSIVLATFAVRDFAPMAVMQIVDATGLLQPTISMAVLRLESDGLLERPEEERPGGASSRRMVGCVVTEAGKARARELIEQIEALPNR